jgi:hypothetical protein
VAAAAVLRARDSPASRRRRFSFSERTLRVCCVSAFLTKDKLRLLKRLMMNLAAAAPARGVLLMQPVGEVREAFSTWIFTARDFLMQPDFERTKEVKGMAAFLPGIFAYHEGFLRFSGSSGCTSRRT